MLNTSNSKSNNSTNSSVLVEANEYYSDFSNRIMSDYDKRMAAHIANIEVKTPSVKVQESSNPFMKFVG